jgi:DNA-binding Xre family transcriptional regulator
MRLRIPELYTERNQSAYQIARDSGGRLTEATLYRIAREKGAVKFVSLDVLQGLCDVFKVEPAELFEYQRRKVKVRRTGRNHA